jgi:LuxR family transcriptional regulator, maltose regulon positive regulatory protein
MRLHLGRGMLELARGRYPEALAAIGTAERLTTLLVSEHTLARRGRSLRLQALVLMGETQRVEHILAEMDAAERDSGEMRIAAAALRLAQDDPEAATVALAPVIEGAVLLASARLWVVQAFLLDAIACDAAGHAAASRRALERALDEAGPEGLLYPFLADPAPDLLDRHRRHGTAHAGLIAEILNVLAGRGPSSDETRGLREPLSQAEVRVLRYLPTKLSAPEIAGQLYLSVNTVKTHLRHLYDKLGVHRRHEAVEQARALGLLAPSPRR